MLNFRKYKENLKIHNRRVGWQVKDDDTDVEVKFLQY